MPKRVLHFFSHIAWMVLAMCFINVVINYAGRLGYSLLLPEMIVDLGFGRMAGANIYNAYLIGYAVGAPLTGNLGDRLGAKPIILTSMGVMGLGLFLLGKSTGVATVAMAYGITGLGSSGIWIPTVALIQRWFALEYRGRVTGVLATGLGFGFSTLGILFPILLPRLGWRGVWMFIGILAWTAIIPGLFALRSSPGKSGVAPWGEPKGRENLHQLGKDSITPPAPSIWVPLRQKQFWVLAMSYFAISAPTYSFSAFMVDYARFQLYLPVSQSSMVATVHGLFQIVGVLLLLGLSDKLGRRITLGTSNTIIGFCIMGVLLVGGNTAYLFPLIAIIGICFGPTFPLYGVYAGDLYSPRLVGTVVGLWTPFYSMGTIFGNWIIGYSRDVMGTYTIGFSIAAALALVSGYLILWGDKKGRQKNTG